MTCPDPDISRTHHVSVTLRLADPRSDLLIRHVALLRDCVALAQHRYPFAIEAACVLPAELQMLCHLPAGEDMSPRLRLIRSAFARHATADGTTRIWEGGPEISQVPRSALENRARFVTQAPVLAGLVGRAEDWAYSSLHKRGAPQPVARVA